MRHREGLLARDGRTVLGVIELYRQPFDLFRAIRSGQRLVWTSAAPGGPKLSTLNTPTTKPTVTWPSK